MTPLNQVLKGLMFFLDWRIWIAPVFFVVMGIVSGMIIEKLLMGTIRKVLHHTTLELNDRIASLLRGVIIGLFTLWGIYMATFSVSFMNPSSLELIRKGVFLVAMLLSIRLLAKVSVVMVRFYLNHSSDMQALPNTSIFENLIRILVFMIGILMLLQTMGISVVPVLTALGVGGLAISLALQDTLANMFSGINMLIARQVKIGDYIRLDGGHEGIVTDIGWRNTTVQQLNKNRVIVPNVKMASAILVNCPVPVAEVPLTVEGSIAYDNDLAHVERIAVDVAKSVLQGVQGAISDFGPHVRFHTFGESGIQFSVFMQVKTLDDQALAKHEFIKRLHARFAQEGIEGSISRRMVHLEPQGINSAMFSLPQNGQFKNHSEKTSG